MNESGLRLRAVAKRIVRPEPLSRKVARKIVQQALEEQRKHLALLKQMRKVTRL